MFLKHTNWSLLKKIHLKMHLIEYIMKLEVSLRTKNFAMITQTLWSGRRISGSIHKSTWALRTTVSGPDDGVSADCWRTIAWHAGNCASDTSAAPAGIERGCERVSVSMNDTLVEAGVTVGAAAVWRDGVGALDWTRSPLTGHHLVLITQKDNERDVLSLN